VSRPQGHSVDGRIVNEKNSNDTIENRTRNLPACSAVPQPTVPPRNKSTIDHIFRICQVLKKKQEYNEREHQLFTDFKKAYDSVTSVVLHNILIEFSISMKP
jgi:hypothetical protein